MLVVADLMGWVAYGMIAYALPKLASEDPRIALKGWYAEIIGNTMAIVMGIMTGLTSVILFNTLFAYMCGATIFRLRKRIKDKYNDS